MVAADDAQALTHCGVSRIQSKVCLRRLANMKFSRTQQLGICLLATALLAYFFLRYLFLPR